MGTQYRGKRDEERALNAYIALMRASLSVNAVVNESLRAQNITERQLAVLEAIYHLGPMRQKELAAKLLCTPGNLTSVIDQLTNDRLLRRVCDKDDARAYQLSLTDSGTKLIERIFPPHVEAITDAFQGLSASEQESLRAICRKLGKSLQTQNT